MPAIGIHHTETDDGAWDGPGNVARLRADETAAYYRKAFAWIDSEGDPTTKAAYKFPHHMVNGEGNIGAASTRGASAGIAVLNGGRGGADIPDSDRRGVYNHLAAHLKDADKEVPELKSSEQWEGIERRFGPAELRVDQTGQIEGYAAVFGVWSEDMGWFRERIRQGAFKKTIREADVRALFNHDPNYVLGRNKASTLDLAEDNHGLQFRVTPPETQWAKDLQESVKRGDINQASFGFQTIKDEWTHASNDSKINERELVEVKLFDVSVVTFPAYPQTSVSARSLANMLIARLQSGLLTADEVREMENLREQIDQLDAETEPGQESHSEEEQQAMAQVRLALRKRRLEIDTLT